MLSPRCKSHETDQLLSSAQGFVQGKREAEDGKLETNVDERVEDGSGQARAWLMGRHEWRC
jgi:hypothetical protein